MAERFFSPETRITVLNIGCEKEAGDFRDLVELEKPDLIVIDNYEEIMLWEALSERVKIPLVVFDDFGMATSADLIVRPHGKGGAVTGGVILGGPAFVPLAPDIRQSPANQQDIDREKAIGLRLNICFGGADPTSETIKVVPSIDRLLASLMGGRIDIIVGPGATFDPSILAESAGRLDVDVHHSPSRSELVRLMSSADIALGAGGVMLWERLHLGLPSIVVATAENQLPQIQTAVSANAIVFVGFHSEVSGGDLAAAVASVAGNEVLRRSLAISGRSLVDGRGTVRIAAWCKALTFETRRVEMEDAAKLLEWRTHPANWKFSWDGGPIPDLASHCKWLQQKVAETCCHFWIVTDHDEPVGVVRFDVDAGTTTAILSIYLVPKHHGRGLGLPVYFAAEAALRKTAAEITTIYSRIHEKNELSIKLHRDAGFDLVQSDKRSEWLVAQKDLDRERN